MYGFLLAIIYLAFISLGLPDSLLGSGWPVIHADLNLPVSFMGIITMVISAGTIISSLCSDRLTKKVGTRFVTVGSVFLTVIALFGFSFSTQFWMLVLFAIPYGIGAGAIDAALNNYVALNYKAKQMSWLHCFWGLGAIISPFVMGYALTNSCWQNGFKTVGTIQLIIAILLLATLSFWNINKKEENRKQQKNKGIIEVLKIDGVICLLIGFFAYCAVETTAMQWASTYFVKVKNVPVERAADFASLFYIGITAGRFISGFVTDKLGCRKMIMLGISVLSVGILLLLLPISSQLLALISFIIMGLGCAPIYPCIIHITPQNFGTENSGAIIGIQMAFAYLGSMLMPPLFGLIGNLAGFKIMPIYLLILVLIATLMIELTFHKTKNNYTAN